VKTVLFVILNSMTPSYDFPSLQLHFPPVLALQVRYEYPCQNKSLQPVRVLSPHLEVLTLGFESGFTFVMQLGCMDGKKRNGSCRKPPDVKATVICSKNGNADAASG